MPASAARRAAFEILLRVETTAAWVDELLHGRLLERLDARDRGLTSQIVLGTLRHRGALDEMIEQSSGRGIHNLDPEVRAALRLGAYQLAYLDRVPDRAAVSESVELVKSTPVRRAAGLANAVLRRLPAPPDPEHAIELSCPEWMVSRWRRSYGPELTRAILDAGLSRPQTWLRLNVRFPLDETLRLLEQEGIETDPTEARWARRLVSGQVQSTDCWRDGRVRIQDVSSQMIVPLLDLEPSYSFLDVCAAPGGKTEQAAEIRGSADGIIACDLHPHRLRLMRRLSIHRFALAALDGSEALPFRRRFDRILVDAPCSGTGTLSRNPDMKWRLEPEDIAELEQRQRAILSRALDALDPAGVLVYATCSLEPEENGDVVDAVLSAKPGWRVTRRLDRLPERDAGDGFYAFRIEAA